MLVALVLAAAPTLLGCGPRAECWRGSTLLKESPDFVSLSFAGGRRRLFSSRFSGAQVNDFGADGTVGARLFHNAWDAFPDVSWLTGSQLIVPWGEGFRVVMSGSVVYVAASNVPGQEVRLTVSGKGNDGFTVERAWLVEGEVFVLGTSPAGLQLGRVQADDTVRVVGSPLDLTAGKGWEGLRYFGGWDSSTNQFLIEASNELVSLSRDGTVLERHAIVGGGPYALHWIRLADGQWAGLQGSNWFRFTPGVIGWRERTMVGDVGVTTSTTQALDENGTLWVVSPNRTGEVVVRALPPGGVLGPEVKSPLLVGVCDLLLTDR